MIVNYIIALVILVMMVQIVFFIVENYNIEDNKDIQFDIVRHSEVLLISSWIIGLGEYVFMLTKFYFGF